MKGENFDIDCPQNALLNIPIEDIDAEHKKRCLDYIPLPYQKTFHNSGKTGKERFISAGNGIGKTTMFRNEIRYDATGYYPDDYEGIRYKDDITLWVYSSDYNIVKNNVYDFLIGSSYKEGLIHPSLILKTTTKPLAAEIKRKDGGIATVHFKSYAGNAEEHAKGLRVNKIFCDEIPKLILYGELLARGISVPNFQIVIVGTPDEQIKHATFLSYFHDDPDLVIGEVSKSGKYLQVAGWVDSPYVPEEEKERYRAIYTEEQLRCREFGLTVKNSGLIYTAKEDTWAIDPIEIPDFWARGYGFDIGWKNQTAALFFAFDRDNRTLYLTGEYYVSEKQPETHSFYLKQMGAEWMTGAVDPMSDSVAQATGETAFNMYVAPKCGLKLVKSTNRKKEIAISEVREMFYEGRLKVFNNLTNFKNEIRNYARKANGEIHTVKDHLMDCLSYIILDGLKHAKSRRDYEYMQARRTPYINTAII